MSSEAAQKAYPEPEHAAIGVQYKTYAMQVAFDAGAVEALRQAGDKLDAAGLYEAANVVLRIEQEWENATSGSLARGLAQSASGDVVDLGRFGEVGQ